MLKFSNIAAALLVLAMGSAQADVTVGVTLSATGPGASLGIPEKNAIALLPTTLGGEKVTYIVLDDATDPTAAARNAQKLVTENRVDVIIGASVFPTSLAAARVAAEGKTPIIAMAPIRPAPESAAWVFTTPPSVAVVAVAVLRHMKAAGVRTAGFVGFNDASGDDWWNHLSQQAESAGIRMVANERYARTDTSVTAQALKVLLAAPDAVFIGGSGTPAALPQITLVERGYKGRFYQNHGSTHRDFIRIGGRSVEGTILPAPPMLVAEQLADGHPSKRPSLEFIRLYEGAHGAGSRSVFGGYAWDAHLLLQRAVPVALRKARPGGAEFRQALRDALEGIRELPGVSGVFGMSAQDHNGLDDRAVVMVTIEGGDWRLAR